MFVFLGVWKIDFIFKVGVRYLLWGRGEEREIMLFYNIFELKIVLGKLLKLFGVIWGLLNGILLFKILFFRIVCY